MGLFAPPMEYLWLCIQIWIHAQSLTALTAMSIHAIAAGTVAVFFDLDSICWEYGFNMLGVLW